jgi:hypothetical protein
LQFWNDLKNLFRLDLEIKFFKAGRGMARRGTARRGEARQGEDKGATVKPVEQVGSPANSSRRTSHESHPENYRDTCKPVRL